MGDLQNYVATANQSPIDLYSAPGNDQLGNGVQPLSSMLVTGCFTALAGVGLLVYLRRVMPRSRGPDPARDRGLGPQGVVNPDNDRCIVQRMNATEKQLVVFFGSQTGNSQDLAERLAKEGHSKFGLQTMVADLEEYDYERLVDFPTDKVAIFMLSSYGEGEPTDNAVQFFEFITSDENEGRFDNMRYGIFGLGNSTYEHYNLVARKVDTSLSERGATRISTLGEADDAKGTTEDDFLSWKDGMWEALSQVMTFSEQETQFEPSFTVSAIKTESKSVFLGERSEDELNGTKFSPSGRHKPSIVSIKHSSELFSSTERNCLHVELEIGKSDLTYETGDHVAIWPMNSNREVDRFLRVFGLLEQRDETIHIAAVDGVSHVPIPTPTTYDAAVRYYLEIAGPISRQFLQTAAHFAVDQQQKEALTKLGNDKEYFAEVVGSRMLNIASLIETISPESPVCPIPFAILIEGVRALQPRYYSISSSSHVQKDEIAITAAVESTSHSGGRWFKGVATNYLLGLKQHKDGDELAQYSVDYALSGPRGKYELSVAAHIRQSHFKLPADISKPVVLVGPGTGVAPFRAFIHERAAQASAGQTPGKTVLFYGCRTQDEDFIYADEWKDCQQRLGDAFEMHTAFSRQSEKKVYVQDKMTQNALTVRSLLLDHGGYFYICGDARMARQVQATLCRILDENTAGTNTGEAFVQTLKSTGHYQEDVW